MRSKSIGRKLISMVMVTSATTIVLACLGFGADDLMDEFGDLQRSMVMLADTIGAHSVAALTFGDHDGAREGLSALARTESMETAAIYSKQGVLFCSYKREPNLTLPAVPGRDGVAFRAGRLQLFRPIVFDGERIGTIFISSDLRDLFARLRNYAILVLGILVVTLVLAFVVSARLQRVIAEPIEELARVARQVSGRKDYALRAASGTGTEPNEMQDLVAGFNDMLAEIERRNDTLLVNQADLEEQVERRTGELSTSNGALVVARDEAQKIADLNERLSRQSALILESVADGIVGIGIDRRVSFLNPAASRMLGRTLADFADKEIHELIHSRHPDGSPYDQEDCPTVIALRQGLAIADVDTFWRADGSSFPVEFAGTPMRDEHGAVLGAVITFRDIGERRAIEKMKDEFVSTVSHELRTPLTSIRGALGLLSSGMLGTVAEKGQRMLQIAVTNTDRLVRLINDILDLERIGSGKIELTRTAAGAGAIMIQAVEGVQSMADAAGVLLVVEPSSTMLLVDHDRIVQTLTNLLSNAIKFSERETTVTVSGRATGDTFLLRVADRGRGVPSDKLETIFERFEQVDASDSRDKGGSGLGLAICRSIVSAHHGRIWAERNPLGGTLFQFTLPIEPTPAEPAALARHRTLLIAREKGSAIPLIVETLEDHGFRVVCLPAAEVTPHAASIAPDAIVLDLAVNSSDGWQIVDALKANEQTRDIPIIMTSGLSHESFESHAEGIASWVRKPIEAEDLIQAVDLVCAPRAILIVEDDADLARVMTASLESRGITTLHAPTGKEALRLCAEQQPILIVLDLGLPDMDGFTVVQSLRKQKTLSGTPLLVYSGMEVGSADQARLELGPTKFLTKSRGSIQEFTTQVVRMLNTITVPAEETNEHAA